MTHLKIVHLILKYWSHGSYISLFFVHYVTGIIRPAHRAPKIGKCNFIGIGWKKRENCTCIRAAGTYGDLGNGPQQILADIYIHPDSRRDGGGEVLPSTYAQREKSNEILETLSPHCKNLAFWDPSFFEIPQPN